MTNWQGQYHNPHEQGWRVVNNPAALPEVDLDSDESEAQIVEVEIVDDGVFQELAQKAEFQEYVCEAYTETGLPESDQSFDQIVNEMIGDLPW